MSETNYFTKDFNSMIKIVVFNSLGFFFLDFLISYFSNQVLNAKEIEIGLIFSLNIIGHLISSLFTGFITDRIKKKTILILIGSFGRGIAYFILYIAFIFNSLLFIWLGSLSIGFFVGFFWIPFNTLVAEKSNKDNRSNAYGKRDGAIGRGILYGSVLGFSLFSFLVTYTSNPFLIYITIPIYAIANFYAGIQFYRKVDESIKFSTNLTLKNEIEIKNNKKNSIKQNYLIFGLVFLSIVLLLGNINGSLAKPYLTIYIFEQITDNETLATLIYFPCSLSLLFAPMLGKIVDKIKPTLGISITSLFGAFITWFLISTTNPIIFSLFLVIDYTIVSTANLVIQNLMSRISLKHRGKIFGIFRFFMNLGMIIGPLLGGFAWSIFDIRAPFLISIIVELSLIPFYIISVYLIRDNLKEKYEFDKKIEIETI